MICVCFNFSFHHFLQVLAEEAATAAAESERNAEEKSEQNADEKKGVGRSLTRL